MVDVVNKQPDQNVDFEVIENNHFENMIEMWASGSA